MTFLAYMLAILFGATTLIMSLLYVRMRQDSTAALSRYSRINDIEAEQTRLSAENQDEKPVTLRAEKSSLLFPAKPRAGTKRCSYVAQRPPE